MRTNTIALLLAVAVAAPLAAQEKKPGERTLTVVGSGEASAKPDMAQVHVGVATEAPTAAAALKANTEAMDRLLKTLTARGIEDKDVQTSAFTVAPRHRETAPGQKQELLGYEVSNQVAVRVRKLADLGALLDDLVGKGANQVHGIRFTLAEPSTVLDRARERAVVDARRKAELYARAAGVKIVNVRRIEETPMHFPQPEMLRFGAVQAQAAPVPVATGELDYHATVTITYTIE
jgi:uncharacterized protein YggE